MPGDKHDWSVPVYSFRTEPGAEFISIHARHFHIRKDDIEVFVHGPRESLDSMFCARRLLKNQLKRADYRPARERFILDHEDLNGRMIGQFLFHIETTNVIQQIETVGNCI